MYLVNGSYFLSCNYAIYSLSTVDRPVEIEQIGQQEMSPFTTLPLNTNAQRGTLFFKYLETEVFFMLIDLPFTYTVVSVKEDFSY